MMEVFAIQIQEEEIIIICKELDDLPNKGILKTFRQQIIIKELDSRNAKSD